MIKNNWKELLIPAKTAGEESKDEPECSFKWFRLLPDNSFDQNGTKVGKKVEQKLDKVLKLIKAWVPVDLKRGWSKVNELIDIY